MLVEAADCKVEWSPYLALVTVQLSQNVGRMMLGTTKHPDKMEAADCTVKGAKDSTGWELGLMSAPPDKTLLQQHQKYMYQQYFPLMEVH